MTLEEAQKLSIGTLVRWIAVDGSYVAKIGATAKVVSKGSPTGYGHFYIQVEWIRDELSLTQHDGGYLHHQFELINTNPPKTQSCNCSDFDLTRFGCRYLQKADSQGLLHS